jgi:hypothetical protein
VVEIRLRGRAVTISASKRPRTKGEHPQFLTTTTSCIILSTMVAPLLNVNLTVGSCTAIYVKECIKLFLVRLPTSRQFIVPRNLKLLAVPLSQVHANAQVC